MNQQRLLAPIDQQQVWRQFARAERRGFLEDPLAREIELRMQERLDYVRIDPKSILDLGAGSTAHAAQKTPFLRTRYPAAQLLLLDAVSQLLPAKIPAPSWRSWANSLIRFGHHPKTRAQFSVCGDARNLPLQKASQDLIWANMLLPWVDDISAVFSESHRVLDKNGLFMFSTLGPDTLKTLNSCFPRTKFHCHDFPDMHDLGDLLSRSGFSDPVVDMEIITVEYTSLSNLLKDLRNAAANNAHQQRAKGLGGRRAWAEFESAWNTLAQSTGKLAVPIRFEVIYGHAWNELSNTLTDGRSIVHFDPKARISRSPKL